MPDHTSLAVAASPWGARMSALTPYVLVGLGGFLGANARYVLARAIGTAVDTRFPLGTFVINVTGSFALGVLGALLAARLTPGSESLKLALGVGFLGAYTTFSTFEFETHVLVEEGAWFLATANMALSLVVGFVAVRVGVALARAWLL